MSSTGGAQRRGVSQWLLVGTTFLCGIGFLIGFVVSEINDFMLSSHGNRTVATVAYIQGSGHNTWDLLDFHDGDGTLVAERTGDVQSGAKVGDRITVVHDPNDPGDVQDVRVLGRGRWAALLFIPLGIFFLWLTRWQFRMSPEEFRGWMLSRYGVLRAPRRGV